MKPKKRQKLCQNCEGEIDLDVIVCPFCAADLREEKPERQRSHFSGPVRNLNESGPSFESLYPPPHAPKGIAVESQSSSTPVSIEAEEEKKNSIFSIFVFTLGMQLALLGMLTLIFSHHGVVILKWSAKFWFVYLFASLPLLVFGYRMLGNKSE